MYIEAIDDRDVIAVDYGMSLQNMIAAGHYDRTSDKITARRIPIVGSGIVKFQAKLHHFDRRISSEQAVKRLTRAGVWEPAKIEHLLAFAAKNPAEQRNYPIVALGSVARVYLQRHVPFVDGDNSERDLELSWWSGYWFDHCRFLAVRNLASAA
jgi:hypothetical protein